MKRNATQPKTRATLRAACRKALACALSAVLVVGLAPTFSIAEAAEDEADAAANAVGDGAAEGAADDFVAPDAMSGTGSQVVSIPEDSTTIHAAVALEGDDSEAASAQSGEVGLPGSPAENAIRDTTSLFAKGGDTASSAAVDGNAAKAPAAVADESNGDGDGASANAEPTVGPNPFKQGVDAQPLLGLDNYDKHVMVDSEGNVDKTETAKRWKTKVGCEGKKMWAGTLIQDNGYWDQPGWSFVVDWPQPNPLHDAEVYAYIEKNYSGTTDGAKRDVVIAEGDAGLTSVNFRDLFDGSHDVYIGDFGFEYNRLSSLSIPSFVKKINMDAFMQDGTNASLTDLQFEEGIECIAGGAFTNCNGLAKQDLIEFPKSLKYLDGGAFTTCGALKVRFDNPDIRFGSQYDSDLDDPSLPFDDGTTVYAYKKKSDGTDSDPYRLSQQDTESSKHYNYVWLDDESSVVTVTGKVELPEGAAPGDVSVVMEQNGALKKPALAEDGSFTCPDAAIATECSITVQIAGYYDKNYLRTASQMGSSWDLGTIAASDFKKIAAQRTLPISVYTKSAANAEGEEALTNITSNPGLSFKLKRDGVDLASGEDADYVVQCNSVVLSEALANEGNFERLSLEVSTSDSLKLTGTTIAYSSERGGFEATLSSWGSVRVSANAAYEGRSHVFLFSGTDANARCVVDSYTSVEWPDGQENPNWILSTGKLKAGTYVVAACKPDTVLSASNLGVLERSGVPYAKAEVEITDNSVSEVTLDVPDYDKEQLLKNAGVKSARVQAPGDGVVAGCETIIEVAYDLDKPMPLEFTFGIPSADYHGVSASLKSSGNASCGVYGDSLVVDVDAQTTSDVLYIAFTPDKQQVYSLPVSLEAGDKVIPLGDASFLARGMTVKVADNCVKDTGNQSTVYSAPSSFIELSIAGQTVGTAYTNALGHAQISFDIPEEVTQGLLFGDYVKLDAKSEQVDAHLDCFYRPGAKIKTFSITNAGETQTRIVDGKEIDDNLTVLYQLPKKKNAYWTFDVTVDNATAQINAGDVLMMYAKLTNGESVAVPLALVSQGDEGSRYVGEYVDEEYLALLEENEGEGHLSSELLQSKNLFIPESYSFSNFALSYRANLDEDYEERAKKRIEDEVAERQQQYSAFWADYWAGFEVDDTTKQQAQEVDAALGEVVAQLAERDDASSEDVQATIAEIEALRPDFRDFGSALAPDDDLWIASIDSPIFTGKLPDDISWTAPTDAELQEWYGDEILMDGNGNVILDENGNEQKLTDIARKSFDEVQQEIEQKNAWARNTQKTIVNGLDKLGRESGVGAPSESGSPYTLIDNVMKKECGDTLTISDGDNAKGEQISSSTNGRFTGDYFVTEEQKNGKDGKTPGIYSGMTARVTEEAPQGVEAPARVTTYTSNFDEAHERSDAAKADMWSSAWSIARGQVLELASGGLDKANEITIVNIINRRLMEHMPVSEVSPLMEAYAKANLFEKEMEEIGRANKMMQTGKGVTGVLGLANDYFGMDSAKNSLIDSGNEIRLIETDIENIYQLIKYWRAYNPCDSDCQRCLDALYAELEAAEKYKEYLVAEDDNNYSDVMRGCGTSTLNAMLAVCSLYGSGSFGAAGSAPVYGFSDLIGNFVSKVSLCADVSSTSAHMLRAPWADVAKNEYAEATAYRMSVCKNSGKKKSEDDKYRETIDWDRFYGSDVRYRNYGANVILDPSGVVYEALESNPVEGATATLWTRGSASGGSEQEWNAEAYEQRNPQTTSGDGSFAWDTPTGQYQVRVSKDGYRDSASEWLNVLPIQTGVNIKLESSKAPEVQEAWADPDCIEIAFDQYMKASDSFEATLDGVAAERIEWVDPQEASEADGYGTLSRVLRIYPKSSLAEGSQVNLAIKGLQNYVGTALATQGGNWSQQLTVSKHPSQLVANFENAVVLQQNASDPVQVIAYVRYADGSPVTGQRVVAKLESGSLASFKGAAVQSDADGSVWVGATTDAEGKASFLLAGELPGMTTLELSASGTNLTKEIAVRVTSDAAQPARPVATIDGAVFDAASPKENSIEVAKGSLLDLSCSTEGATIYYTTDDTCPCVEGGSRVEYAGPIPVMQNTRFRITAYKDGMAFDSYSERLNLNVTVANSTDPSPDNPGGGATDPENPGGGTINPDNPGGGVGGNGSGSGSGNGDSSVNGGSDDAAAGGSAVSSGSGAASAVAQKAAYASTNDASIWWFAAFAAIVACLVAMACLAARKRER